MQTRDVWHISTSILQLDYKVKLQSKYIGAANYYSKQHNFLDKIFEFLLIYYYIYSIRFSTFP